MSAEEMVSLTQRAQPGDVDYVPPATIVPLPSQGKVYPKDSPMAGTLTPEGVNVLEVKAMTAKEEDILTSQGLLRQGKALDALMRSCVLDRRVDIDNLLSGDRNAILIAIRITGYGNGYKIKAECPACGEKNEQEFDLARLPIKPMAVEPVEANVNLFSFTLPISRKEVRFRLMTGADERELSTTLERQRKQGSGMDNLVTSRLHHQVVSIGTEKDRTKLQRIITSMPARDSRELRSFMDRINPGVEMKQEMTCRSCGETTEVDVPMGTEFFWPEA